MTFVGLALLVYRLDAAALRELIRRLRVSRSVEADLVSVGKLRDAGQMLGSAIRASQVYHLLYQHSARAIWTARLATDDPRARTHIDRFTRDLRDVKPSIGGAFLRSLGLRAGPTYGRILHAMRDAMLDGQVRSVEEEHAFVRQWIEEKARLDMDEHR